MAERGLLGTSHYSPLMITVPASQVRSGVDTPLGFLGQSLYPHPAGQGNGCGLTCMLGRAGGLQGDMA